LPECSDADKSRARQNIIERYDGAWRRKFEEDRRKTISAAHVENEEPGSGEIKYDSRFDKTCAVGYITARYEWKVSANDNGARRGGGVAKKKSFMCVKGGGTWECFSSIFR
jgi:hypothetical protein